MVYRRRRRRRYRGYRLSKFNLYRRSGAKAQAMQIYRVNKRLNNYQKKNKPKVMTVQNTLSFNAAGAAQTAFGSPTSTILNEPANADRTLFRLHSATLTFCVTTETRLQEILIDGIPAVYMRVIVFQYKAAHSNLDTAPWLIFSVTQQNFQSNDAATRKAAAFQCIHGPLQPGITAKIRILRDFKLFYGINATDRATKKCVLKRLQNVRIAPQKQYPAGALFWVAVWWNNIIGQGVEDKSLKLHIYQKVAYSSSK